MRAAVAVAPGGPIDLRYDARVYYISKAVMRQQSGGPAEAPQQEEVRARAAPSELAGRLREAQVEEQQQRVHLLLACVVECVRREGEHNASGPHRPPPAYLPTQGSEQGKARQGPQA